MQVGAGHPRLSGSGVPRIAGDMSENDGWIEGSVHYRVPVRAADLAKVFPMGPFMSPRNFVLENLGGLALGVLASLIAWRIEVATGTSGFLSGVATALARIVPWLTVVAAFLSTLGVVYIVRSVRDFVQSRRERIDPDLIEIDLASSNPIRAQLRMVTPQIWVSLCVTNHSDFDIRINRLTAKVYFGQTLILLTKETHVDVSAHATARDVHLMTTLDAQKQQLDEFFGDSANLTRVVYTDVTAACQAGTTAFTISPHFERHLPELNSIPR